MFRIRYKISNIVIISIPIFLTIWPYIIEISNKKAEKTENISIIWQLAIAGRYVIPFLSVLLFLFIQFYRLIVDNEYKKVLSNITEQIHFRYFPKDQVGCDPDYRVSLFVPTVFKRIWKIPFIFGKRYLKCYVRSGTPKRSKVRWCINDSENGAYDGVVGFGWATGIFVEIDNLPEYNENDDDCVNKYMKTTYITPDKIKKLNVLSRSYRCLVIKNRRGDKIGVLMMESINPQGLVAISSDSLVQEAQFLQCLFL